MMPRQCATYVLMGLGLALALQGCAELTPGNSPKTMVQEQDHRALVGHFTREAEELRLKATRANDLADIYEALVKADSTTEEGQRLAKRAARVRDLAQDYRKAAAEAEAMAAEHRGQLPGIAPTAKSTQ